MLNEPNLINFIKNMERFCYLLELIDVDGCYRYMTPNSELWPYAFISENVIGKHVTEAYDDYKGDSLLLRSLHEGIVFNNCNVVHQGIDGKEYHYLTDCCPLWDNNGEIIGAFAVSKPVHQLLDALKNCEEKPISKLTLSKKVNNDSSVRYSFSDIIHTSSRMANEIENAKKIASNMSNVLIIGETGTGKELFAQSIHAHSKVSDHPFIAVNCGAIPSTLIESILFGTSKGAFTGAVAKAGLFEEAQNGTIFLDEVNSMQFDMQVKLLRTLQTGFLRRVGSTKEIAVNPRVISAINMKPADAIQQGFLRADLFYRLASAMVEVPPLRERKEDINALCNFFIKKYCNLFHKQINKVSSEVMDLFLRSDWQGNVRELEHVIEHAINISQNHETEIHIHHLSYYFLSQFKSLKHGTDTPYVTTAKPVALGNYKQIRAEAVAAYEFHFTKDYITNALLLKNGKIQATADALQISRQHLHKLIKDCNIDLPDIRKRVKNQS